MRRIHPLLLTPLAAASLSAITIEIDYSYDTSNFFSTYTAAQAALEAAASDIGLVINSSLGAVNNDVFRGTNGSTFYEFDWSLSFTNPSTGATETLTTFNVAADTIRLYAGARSLTGSTLGQGGPGSAGLSTSGSGVPVDFPGAVTAAETLSNATMLRGGQAPVIGSFSGVPLLGSTPASYTVGYAPIIGNIWFDNDSDNVGGADNEATLLSYWHFDHTTDVASGHNDFYSVALHEILHALGIGTAETWVDQVDGTSWSGTEASELYGSSLGLIQSVENGVGGHIAAGVFSTRLSDDGSQEVVMDPNLTTGTRKTLTALDLAFLQDLNYSVSAVPEPAETAAAIGLLSLLAVGCQRRRRA